jgi:hypothetical protein
MMYRGCDCFCCFLFTFEYLPENLGGMDSGSGEDTEGGVFVRLVEKKIGEQGGVGFGDDGGGAGAADTKALDRAG